MLSLTAGCGTDTIALPDRNPAASRLPAGLNRNFTAGLVSRQSCSPPASAHCTAANLARRRLRDIARCSSASDLLQTASDAPDPSGHVPSETGSPVEHAPHTIPRDWRAKSKPIKPGGVYPAKELCSQCGLCDT